MSEEDQAEIRSWYSDEYGLTIHEHLADSAKGYLDRPLMQEKGGEFLLLWARHAKTYAHEYLEAFLMLNVGSWYPDDLSHSTIYPDASYNDKGYLQLNEYDLSQYDIHTSCYLPAVRDFYERICRRNEYQKYPVISILFCTATPVFYDRARLRAAGLPPPKPPAARRHGRAGAVAVVPVRAVHAAALHASAVLPGAAAAALRFPAEAARRGRIPHSFRRQELVT